MAQIEVRTEVSGSVWKIVTDVGQRVDVGDTIMIIESMKMEIPVTAEHAAIVSHFFVEEKASVTEGQAVALLTA